MTKAIQAWNVDAQRYHLHIFFADGSTQVVPVIGLLSVLRDSGYQVNTDPPMDQLAKVAPQTDKFVAPD